LKSGAQTDRILAPLNPQKTTIVILATLFVSLALSEDFKTVSGKIYKDATISRVEADGIVLRTKTGISRSFSLNFLKTFRKDQRIVTISTALRRLRSCLRVLMNALCVSTTASTGSSVNREAKL
jgi:hypothetical protein